MNLLNATKFQAAYTMGVDKHGRESVVVVVKGTFAIPDQPGEEAVLAPEQQPLLFADEYTGEPGFSAPLRETDFSPIKHRCDVLLTGSAYAPGRPVTRLRVGLKVGPLVKSFDVVGDRRWEVDAFLRFRPGKPEPFEVMPISYDNAFGGRDEFSPDPAKHSAYMANPVGRGWHRKLDQDLVIGTPLPNTEESDRPVEQPDGDYRPMAFGPVGRGWFPRLRYAGTYDDTWLEEHFPFLPPDFDEAYFQAAPRDQQIPFLQGGEEVVLWHLTLREKVHFRLPTVQMPVVFFRKRGEKTEKQARCDTLHLEPDRGILTLTWRATELIRRDIFEFTEILVGEMPRAWWRARETGKTWYPSLAHLVDTRRRETLEEE